MCVFGCVRGCKITPPPFFFLLPPRPLPYLLYVLAQSETVNVPPVKDARRTLLAARILSAWHV